MCSVYRGSVWNRNSLTHGRYNKSHEIQFCRTNFRISWRTTSTRWFPVCIWRHQFVGVSPASPMTWNQSGKTTWRGSWIKIFKYSHHRNLSPLIHSPKGHIRKSLQGRRQGVGRGTRTTPAFGTGREDDPHFKILATPLHSKGQKCTVNAGRCTRGHRVHFVTRTDFPNWPIAETNMQITPILSLSSGIKLLK
jgi:hypothetical protein